MRSVIPNSFRNRKIEVDGLGFCSRKRDFQALATLWETRHFSQNQRFWKKQSNKFRVTKMRSVIPNLFRNRKIEVDGLNLLPEVYIQNLISSQWRKNAQTSRLCVFYLPNKSKGFAFSVPIPPGIQRRM